MGRVLLLSLLVGYLGWTLVTVLRTTVTDWRHSLETAQAMDPRGSDSPMGESRIG